MELEQLQKALEADKGAGEIPNCDS